MRALGCHATIVIVVGGGGAAAAAAGGVVVIIVVVLGWVRLPNALLRSSIRFP